MWRRIEVRASADDEYKHGQHDIERQLGDNDAHNDGDNDADNDGDNCDREDRLGGRHRLIEGRHVLGRRDLGEWRDVLGRRDLVGWPWDDRIAAGFGERDEPAAPRISGGRTDR